MPCPDNFDVADFVENMDRRGGANTDDELPLDLGEDD